MIADRLAARSMVLRAESKVLWSQWGGVCAVVLFGSALRLYRLDYQSIWSDEAFSLAVSRMPFAEMNNALVQDVAHPPLHYYILHLWYSLFGFGDFQARFLSAFFGILAIGMVYLLAKYLSGRQVALVSALLLGVSQISIMYSQEARPYAQVSFFAICAAYFFVRALREKNAFAWWAFVGSTVLMLYSHYYSVFVLVALLFYAALYRKRYPLPVSWLIGGVLVTTLFFIPWLASGVVDSALNSGKILGSQAPWFAVDRWTLLQTLGAFNNGKVDGVLNDVSRRSFLIGILLFSIPAVFTLVQLVKRPVSGSDERVRNEGKVFLALLWVLPVLIAYGLAVIGNQYDNRYVLFSVAPYYVLVASGICELRLTSLRLSVIILVLGFSIYALRGNYYIPYKEDYRDALAQLAREYRPADCAVFAPYHDLPLEWSIYQGDSPKPRVTSPDAAVSGEIKCDRVWLISYRRIGDAIIGDDEAERTLQSAYAKNDERQYFWVYVGLFQPLAK